MPLIRHLELDDNAASTTVVATVGADATLEGGDNTSAKAASGPGGSITWSLDLNGTDDAINVGTTEFATSTAFTISLWLRPDVLTTRQVLGRAGSSFRGLTLFSATEFRVETSLANYTFAVPTMTAGTWYHLYITRTPSNSLRLWLNGTESSTGALTGTGILTFDRIGRRVSTYFDGAFSQYRLWDSDETADVATWYAEGVGGGSSLPVFQHYYRRRRA